MASTRARAAALPLRCRPECFGAWIWGLRWRAFIDDSDAEVEGVATAVVAGDAGAEDLHGGEVGEFEGAGWLALLVEDDPGEPGACLVTDDSHGPSRGRIGGGGKSGKSRTSATLLEASEGLLAGMLGFGVGAAAGPAGALLEHCLIGDEPGGGLTAALERADLGLSWWANGQGAHEVQRKVAGRWIRKRDFSVAAER